jgi:hypothetical protein
MILGTFAFREGFCSAVKDGLQCLWEMFEVDMERFGGGAEGLGLGLYFDHGDEVGAVVVVIF